MKKIRIREISVTAAFIAVLGVFAVANRLVPLPGVLPGERRPPALFPELSAQTLLDAEFMRKFEDFAADTVAWREDLRTLRAVYLFNVYAQTDKDGLFVDPSVGAGKITAPDETGIRNTAEKLRGVAERFLTGLDVYCAVIPDKIDYAARFYPGVNPGAAAEILRSALPEFSHIDLSGALDANAYYKTDLHWRQTRLSAVASALGNAISGHSWHIPDDLVQSAGSFQGVYPGQLALPMSPDEMEYYDVPVTALYLNERTLAYEPGEVYDFGSLTSVDPYSFFLRGPQAVIKLSGNPDAERTLYIFRDSFTSSLAPLIAASGEYKSVVLIDLRYIDTRILGEFVEFETSGDALFLYGAAILNDSSIFKVN